MKVFAMAASLRSASQNKRLIAAAKTALDELGHTTDVADFGEFTMPLYNGDLQEADGIPAGTQALAERISAADAVVIASPEYNYSIPGVLKNAIDWLSRMRPNPFHGGKPVMLMSTSPGSVGGVRGLWQTRIPFEGIGAYVHSDMVYLPHGHQAIGDGRLNDEEKQKELGESLAKFLAAAKALNGRSGA
ncbi:MAG: NAD(P)H-dependent oxidoreductase [Myxococcota bacterium]